MRAVSQELEILGRHQHPDLTISFLKVILSINDLYIAASVITLLSLLIYGDACPSIQWFCVLSLF